MAKDTTPNQKNHAPDDMEGWIFIPPIDSPSPYDAQTVDDAVAQDGNEPALMDLKFDLADLPDATAQPPAKPTLTGGERSRALKKVRADLDYADSNNDGRLDAAELDRYFNLAPQAKQFVGAVSTALKAEVANAVAANRALNPDLGLGVRTAPYVTVPIPTSAHVADLIVMDRAVLKQALAEAMQLDPNDVEKAIRRVLPNGVQEYKISTACEADSGLLCAPEGLGIEVRLKPREII